MDFEENAIVIITDLRAELTDKEREIRNLSGQCAKYLGASRSLIIKLKNRDAKLTAQSAVVEAMHRKHHCQHTEELGCSLCEEYYKWRKPKGGK